MTKPPYRVPSMDEIRAIEPNGLRAASLFSGCGGSSLGYRMAGFTMVYANEFIEAARDTYKANASEGTYLDDRDIRSVSGRDILDLVGEVDLLDGSPPCSSFSTAGKREKQWGKEKKYSATVKDGDVGSVQRTDDLFFEYARILRTVRPRVFVAENVSGLVKGSAKGYFKLILAELKSCGYRVSAQLLDASWLGVPQKRQRLIFVGVREDQPFDPVFPKPLPYRYTVRDAIGLPEHAAVIYDTHGNFPIQDTTEEPVNTITTQASYHLHVFGDDVTVDPETGQDLSFRKYSVYQKWRNLKPGQSPKDNSYFNLIRVDPSQPAPTMAAMWGASISLGAATHWSVPRRFTIAECRRLCGFPDDFVLTGNYAQRWERLGRAVPPVMMAAIAAPLADKLLGR